MKQLIGVILVLCLTSVVYAENKDLDLDSGSKVQCAEMIKECFSSSGVARTNCFYTSAKHPFCEGTEVGKLSYKRWTIGANTQVDGNNPPGLLGPNFYDEKCISNCDTKWLSELVPNDLTTDSINGVGSCFDSCKKDNSLEILRP